MKICITLISVVLLATFANGAEDLDSLKQSFDDTVRGRCQTVTTQASTTGAGSTGTGTNGGAGSTSPTANRGTGSSTDSATSKSPTTVTTPTTTPTTTPNTTTVVKTMAKQSVTPASGRKKRDTSSLCGIEETKVSQATDVSDFQTKIKDYSNCQKVNCTFLNEAVDKLIKDSGASSLKIFGSLLVVMLVITFFG